MKRDFTAKFESFNHAVNFLSDNSTLLITNDEDIAHNVANTNIISLHLKSQNAEEYDKKLDIFVKKCNNGKMHYSTIIVDFSHIDGENTLSLEEYKDFDKYVENSINGKVDNFYCIFPHAKEKEKYVVHKII